MRSPSPSEIRTGLDPAAVDALAEVLHTLLCPRGLLNGPTPRDRARARFILLDLRERDWKLTR
jgi:hypothetical protein